MCLAPTILGLRHNGKGYSMPANEEKRLKREIEKRGGTISIRTIHPNPNKPEEYAHVYVVRKPGKRGGKTIQGPIQKGKK